MTLVSEKEDVKEIEKSLNLSDDEVYKATPVDLPDSAKEIIAESEMPVEVYCLIYGDADLGTMQLKVISIFDMAEVKETPNAESLLNEIEFWNSKAVQSIAENAGMLKLALKHL